MTKTIVYLVPPDIHQEIAANRPIIKEYGVQCSQVETIQDLMFNLGDPHYKVDAILIDLDYLYTFEGAGAFELLSTLNTLSKCTLYRDADKTTRRKVSIAALVHDKSNIDAIKDFMSLHGNCGFVMYSFTPGVSCEDLKTAITEVLAGQTHIPRHVRDLLKSVSKRKREAGTIILTPRESQILNIIRERGASNKIIAKMLNISESTVKLHIGKVLKKYGVKNRTQLAVFSRSA